MWKEPTRWVQEKSAHHFTYKQMVSSTTQYKFMILAFSERDEILYKYIWC
jgi:hypothetical protein